MVDDKSKKKGDVKITELPKKNAADKDDAKVKGGMMSSGGGKITYTGEEIDKQSGA